MSKSIAELERENAELRESEHESEALRMSLSDKLTRIAVAVKGEPPPLTLWGWDDLPEVVATQAERIKALESHIQEAADDAKSNEMASAVNGECYQVKYFNKLRAWHLAALQPKEPNNG